MREQKRRPSRFWLCRKRRITTKQYFACSRVVSEWILHITSGAPSSGGSSEEWLSVKEKHSHNIELLQTDSGEIQALFNDLLIRVTSFFRDPAIFDGLTRIVFPTLLEAHVTQDPLRIWIPGCASGEEVYSVAICLTEFLNGRPNAPHIQIFGTDVSSAAIEIARAGSYLESIAAEVSPDRLRRFFGKVNDRFQVAKSIRELCIFAKHDITHDPPFSRIDLISCRNVLIYLDSALQGHVSSLFHYALKPHGFLVLGPIGNRRPKCGFL